MIPLAAALDSRGGPVVSQPVCPIDADMLKKVALFYIEKVENYPEASTATLIDVSDSDLDGLRSRRTLYLGSRLGMESWASPG